MDNNDFQATKNLLVKMIKKIEKDENCRLESVEVVKHTTFGNLESNTMDLIFNFEKEKIRL